MFSHILAKSLFLRQSMNCVLGFFIVFNLLNSQVLAQGFDSEISGSVQFSANETPVILSDSMFTETGVIQLGVLDGWYYSPTDSAHYRNVDLDVSHWERLKP